MSVIVTRSAGGSQPSAGGNLVLVSEYAVSPAPSSAMGTNSIVLGESAQTSLTASNSIAIGTQSLARLPGSIAFANGRFGSSGDAQTGKYLLRTHTVSSTPTEAFIDGTNGSQRLVLPDDSTWTFRASIVAHRTDNIGHAGYTIDGVIFRQAGASTTSFQGAPIKTIIAESHPAWDINISTDTTHGSLAVIVTGEAGQTIRWLISIETVEITN